MSPITIHANKYDNQIKILDYVSRIYASAFSTEKVDWANLFSLTQDGKLWATKFYDLSVSDTIYGERMNDSIGMTCEPSTTSVTGQDDFSMFNAFWTCDCNFRVGPNGNKIITAIDGQANFSRSGKVDVGVLTPPLYWGIMKVSDGEIWYLSDAPNDNLGLTLMPHCRDNRGNEQGFGLLTKYYAGLINDVMYSSSGLPAGNFISYSSFHDYMTEKGVGYVGAGSETTAYLMTMLRIKYAVSSSQAIFTGRTDHDCVYAAVADSTDYIAISTDDVANLFVGDCISICDSSDRSDMSEPTLITAIETDEDDSTISRIYTDETFECATGTTYILTSPMISGDTDNVLGKDGYVSNDGTRPFKLQGIEEGIGANCISMNELSIIENDGTTLTNSSYMRNWGDYYDSIDDVQINWIQVGTVDLTGYTDDLTSASDNSIWVGEIDMDLTTGAWVLRNSGSGSVSGTGDKLIYVPSDTGLHEMSMYGTLSYGSAAGLVCYGVTMNVDETAWSNAARVY